MYASLIAAGVSKLSDLLQSATSSSASSSDTSFSVPSSSTSRTAPPATAPAGTLSTDLNQLFLDLQASQGATTPSATTVGSVAKDLQSVGNDLGKSALGAHGHHHHHGADADGAGQTSAATSSPSGTSFPGNSFQSLASSLLAYSNSQGLTAGQGSTASLTA